MRDAEKIEAPPAAPSSSRQPLWRRRIAAQFNAHHVTAAAAVILALATLAEAPGRPFENWPAPQLPTPGEAWRGVRAERAPTRRPCVNLGHWSKPSTSAEPMRAHAPKETLTAPPENGEAGWKIDIRTGSLRELGDCFAKPAPRLQVDCPGMQTNWPIMRFSASASVNRAPSGFVRSTQRLPLPRNCWAMAKRVSPAITV
jgi:hypothetical protein